MKSVGIVTDSLFKNSRINVGVYLANNVRYVFGDKVIINNYYIDQLKSGDEILDDLVLVMTGSRANLIKDYVPNPANIVVARRTFLKSGIEPLLAIPEGTDVLVVNDNIETILESISTLYHIGVKHVNLIPYRNGRDFSHIKVAISPSEHDIVPDYIENTIDVKSRVLDVSTMFFMMSTFEINDKETQQNFYNYYQSILSLKGSIEDNYYKLLVRAEELDYLLDLSKDGILLTDTDGRILIYNKRFKEIFSVREDCIGRYLHEIFAEVDFKEYYQKEEVDDLIEYRKKYINIDKKDIVHYNKEIKMYFSFQEVTHIKKLEQNLTKKLRQKGQIAKYTFADIVSDSKNISEIIEKSKKIACSDLTVLITGESGTGKEVLAQAIHNSSTRSKQPFIAVNAAAIPENLLESELFGYVKGSFTGALKEGKQGLFEQANNGTIFLDEIGDMPKHLQSKLLRVLQEKQIAPIGADHVIDIDVRIIAATHKQLIKMVDDGSFRKDLFYRLNVFPLEIPPLRERKEDIPLLLNNFTNYKYEITQRCLDIIKNYHWPGNIRELNNVARYISTIEEGKIITLNSLPDYLVQNKISSLIKNSKNKTLEKEWLYLEEKSDLNLAFEVLKAVQFLNDIKKTAGRKHLLETLSKTDVYINESKLRKILSDLDHVRLIIIKKGRAGSYLTETGSKFMQEYTANKYTG